MLKLPFLPFKKQITIAKAIALGISALALVATQTTAADWVSAGPAPVINGGDMGITSPEGANPITGSINTFAPHPDRRQYPLCGRRERRRLEDSKRESSVAHLDTADGFGSSESLDFRRGGERVGSKRDLRRLGPHEQFG